MEYRKTIKLKDCGERIPRSGGWQTFALTRPEPDRPE